MICEHLDDHPAISLSRSKEPMFFSRDEPAIHRHRFMRDPDEWAQFDWDTRRGALLAEYARCFLHADSGALLGEGSTSYFPSRNAPGRIRQLNPDARIVVILRNPVDRAYSAYWHYLAHGESCQAFEQHLQYESGLTITMGEYRRHLEYWLRVFPRRQFHLLVLEDFRKHARPRFSEVLSFLGVDPNFVPSMERNVNRARVPKSVWLQTWINYLQQRSASVESGWQTRLWARITLKNLAAGDYPPMRQDTRRHLTSYYQRVNKGLSDIVGIDVDAIWFGERDV